MKVLVTGGAGFIGSHLVEALLLRGHEVVVLDNLTTGSHANLANVYAKIKFIEGDVMDDGKVLKALTGVEGVAQLAALTSVPESFRMMARYREVNAGGTQKVANLAAFAKAHRFVLASSCAVYGDPEKLPITEKAPLKPLSPYAESKVWAEEACVQAASRGMGVCILRLFNVYGPRAPVNQYSGVITKFATRLRQNLPPVIYGDGKQTRDFIFVADAVKYFIAALEGKAVGTYNVGTGKGVTVNQLAETMTNITGRKPLKPEYMESRKGEIMHSRADMSATVKAFGVEPEYSLVQGLVQTLNE
jgi:UDP-glucose 4-epimerase